jgi:hypothetical protein
VKVQNIDFNAKEVAGMTKEQFVKQHKDDYPGNTIDLGKVYDDCTAEVKAKAGGGAAELPAKPAAQGTPPADPAAKS